MLKICGDTICKPLELVSKQTLTTSVFRLNVKKAILSLVTKRRQIKPQKIPLSFSTFYLQKKKLKDSYLIKCLVSFWLIISYNYPHKIFGTNPNFHVK